jgi:uncharacterized protein YndB with AHSA1/START domain
MQTRIAPARERRGHGMVRSKAANCATLARSGIGRGHSRPPQDPRPDPGHLEELEASMKIVKWLFALLLALAAVLVVGGWLLSPKFVVTRSVLVQAPPDKVYALVAEPRRWKEWSVWNQRDPAMQITYSGPSAGAGAAWEWKSATQGDGKMTLTAAEPGRRVAFDLYFPDFGTTSRGELVFGGEGSGTRVAWTMHGDMGANPLLRWMTLFADGMVGKDFDAGLANLKALAERP